MNARVAAPTLFVNVETARRNIARMKQKADASGSILQPHFKAHQSLQIAALFREQGIEQATVSSLRMARYFSSGGWNKLHLAMPIIEAQKEVIKAIAQNCAITVNVSTKTHIEALRESGVSGALIDIDTGYGRTGVNYQNEDEIARLIALLHQSGIDFKGFYNHNGLTYYEDNREAIKQLHHGNVQKMLTLRSQIAPDTLLIMGDTPGFSVCDDFNGIDFVSAGNYVFYDFMQYSIGSCALNDIAVYMVCPIIEKRAVESTLILHGGAIHFSKDSMQHRGFNTFGQPAILKNDERFELIDGYLSGLSQEHGLLKLLPEEFKNYEIGDSIVILPVHSCLTADSMDSYLDTRGEPIAMM